MALSVASIKAVIKAKREAACGPPDDPVLADKIYEADAEWIFEVLTSLSATSTTVTGGSSAGTYPGTIL